MTKQSGYGPRKKTMSSTYRADKDAGAKKVNTSIWLDPELHRRLKVAAAVNETTITALLEEGGEHILKKYETK